MTRTGPTPFRSSTLVRLGAAMLLALGALLVGLPTSGASAETRYDFPVGIRIDGVLDAHEIEVIPQDGHCMDLPAGFERTPPTGGGADLTFTTKVLTDSSCFWEQAKSTFLIKVWSGPYSVIAQAELSVFQQAPHYFAVVCNGGFNVNCKGDSGFTRLQADVDVVYR